MSKGRVLIIEADEWEVALLRKFLGDAGFGVEVATSARQGFDRIRELQPDCILCNVNLPDIDGFWVARRVRTEPSAVSTTPFLFLTEAGDTESRLQGLHVGADLYLTKPLRNEEVVAQVGALIEMANRLRKQRESFSSDGPSSTRGSAFQGDVAQVSLSTVLTLLDLERRSGKLKVKAEDGQRAELDLAEGKLVAVRLGGEEGDPTEQLRELLRWKTGSFAFKPDPDGTPPRGDRPSLGGVLLEAMRREDEAKAGAGR
ncbi:MAG TPA: response regulator [Polyangiaceae bacterium]